MKCDVCERDLSEAHHDTVTVLKRDKDPFPSFICTDCDVRGTLWAAQKAAEPDGHEVREDHLEACAALEHQQWAAWTSYMLDQIDREDQDDGRPVRALECVKRWRRQIATPYGELLEGEKESDRKEVRIKFPFYRGLKVDDVLIESLRKATSKVLVGKLSDPEVRCDETTTSPEDIAKGMVRAEIGFSLAFDSILTEEDCAPAAERFVHYLVRRLDSKRKADPEITRRLYREVEWELAKALLPAATDVRPMIPAVEENYAAMQQISKSDLVPAGKTLPEAVEILIAQSRRPASDARKLQQRAMWLASVLRIIARVWSEEGTAFFERLEYMAQAISGLAFSDEELAPDDCVGPTMGDVMAIRAREAQILELIREVHVLDRPDEHKAEAKKRLMELLKEQGGSGD